MDFDNLSIQAVLDAISVSGLIPHAIVQSSPGDHYHIYWLVYNFLVERFRPVQLSLIKKFGSDPKVKNESRVMRLAGYFHQKAEPFETKVVFFNPDIPKYSEQQIIDGLGLTFEAEPTSRILRLQNAADRRQPKELGERDDTLFHLACELEAKNATFDATLNECLAANQNYKPPYDTPYVEAKVRSAWKYRDERLAKLAKLYEQLKAATKEKRVELIQDAEDQSLLRLAIAVDPALFSKIEDLFKSKMKYLKEATKTGPSLTIAGTSANQILKEIPGFPNTYPGSFEGFPTLGRYEYKQTEKGVSLFYFTDKETQCEVCHCPVFITKRFVSGGQDAFLEVAWLENDKWKYLKEPRGQFFNANKIVNLADRKFPVGSVNAKALAQYLQAFEATFIDLLPEQQISFQMGWHGDVFLLGTECISSSDSTQIEFQASDTGEKHIIEGLKAKGQYEKWVEAVNTVSRYTLPMIALYASFSAPLIKILEVSNLGVDFSGRTSTGKTTILRLAASVWGQPDESMNSSMTRTWDATDVAVERSCELLSDLPMILDDTKRAKPEVVGRKLYMITSGQGRGRGSKAGLRETQSWRTTLISSGEAAAVSYTQDAGVRARILTLRGSPFGSNSNMEMVNKLNITIKNHYGHAGRLWIKWLLDNKDRWDGFKERLDELRLSFNPTNGPESRLAEKAALIALTGELVHEALELPWEYSNPIKLVWDKIKSESKELDIHIRGARSIYEWAVGHSTSFYKQHKKDDFSEPIYRPMDGPVGGTPKMKKGFLKNYRRGKKKRRNGIISTSCHGSCKRFVTKLVLIMGLSYRG